MAVLAGINRPCAYAALNGTGVTNNSGVPSTHENKVSSADRGKVNGISAKAARVSVTNANEYVKARGKVFECDDDLGDVGDGIYMYWMESGSTTLYLRQCKITTFGDSWEQIIAQKCSSSSCNGTSVNITGNNYLCITQKDSSKIRRYQEGIVFVASDAGPGCYYYYNKAAEEAAQKAAAAKKKEEEEKQKQEYIADCKTNKATCEKLANTEFVLDCDNINIATYTTDKTKACKCISTGALSIDGKACPQPNQACAKGDLPANATAGKYAIVNQTVKCAATACKSGTYLVVDANGNSQGWCTGKKSCPAGQTMNIIDKTKTDNTCVETKTENQTNPKPDGNQANSGGDTNAAAGASSETTAGGDPANSNTPTGETITISGIVMGTDIDSKGNQTTIPLELAHIRAKDTAQNAAVTDAEGKFKLTLPANVELVTVSFMGYVSQDLPPKVDMGTIILQESSSQLEEATVIGLKCDDKKEGEGVASMVGKTCGEDDYRCIPNACDDGYNLENADTCDAKCVKTPDKKDAGDRQKELQENADKMKEKEQNLVSRLTGAAAIGGAGIGGQQIMSAMAEKSADEDAERDMRAYLQTFRCDFGQGKNILGGELAIETPGGNDMFDLHVEYAALAESLKQRKNALNLRPGIEAEVVWDKAETGLYNNAATGRTGGAYASVARAIMDPNGPDAEAWAKQKSDAASKLKTGAIIAGVGIAAGIAGNIYNEVKYGSDKSSEINSKYDTKNSESGDAAVSDTTSSTTATGQAKAANAPAQKVQPTQQSEPATTTLVKSASRTDSTPTPANYRAICDMDTKEPKGETWTCLDDYDNIAETLTSKEITELYTDTIINAIEQFSRKEYKTNDIVCNRNIIQSKYNNEETYYYIQCANHQKHEYYEYDLGSPDEYDYDPEDKVEAILQLHGFDVGSFQTIDCDFTNVYDDADFDDYNPNAQKVVFCEHSKEVTFEKSTCLAIGDIVSKFGMKATYFAGHHYDAEVEYWGKSQGCIITE